MNRIGFVSTMATFPWGGSEALWSQTALRLKQRGLVVGCNVCWWPNLASPIQELERAGCLVEYRNKVFTLERRSNEPLLPWRVRNGLRQILRPLVDGSSARSWLDRLRPDLVIISQGYHLDGLEWKEACLARKVPYAPLVQSVGDCGWPGDDYAARLAQTYEAAAVCFFVCESNQQFTRSQLATPLGNVKNVRNPFNVVVDGPLPWPPSEDGVLRLACVARLECMQKGQDILFDVLRAPKWKERGLHVTLFGSGPNRETLVALKELYGLNNVTFGGVTDDIAGLWRTHHALVLPSRYEGMPLVVVEAMLCGRPCIVTDVGGSAEMVRDEQDGFVAVGPKPALLDDALERAWQRRAEWPQIGVSAAARVRDLVPPDPVGTFADEVMKYLT